MFDAYGRNIHYLRLSVTDLCNLRCRYCMPDGVEKLEREAVLTYEEFLRLAALFAQCGIDTVRVTGGEPLVRKNVAQLVAGLKATPGIRRVTLTTNAVLLAEQLPALLDAGIREFTIANRTSARADALADALAQGAGQQLGWGFQLQMPGVVAALAVLFTLIGLVIKLISDLCYVWVDPRVKFD